MRKMLSLARACIDRYAMIAPGDKIVVGVSGGKDSLTLLAVLAELRRFYPHPFELEAVSLAMGFEDMDFDPVAQLCRRLDVPYTVRETNIKQVVFDIRQEKNPCSLCAKLRRGALNRAATELGANKVALGHHQDDAVETFMLSLLYEGGIRCFQPTTFLDRTGVTQVRPLLFVKERQIRNFAIRQALHVVHNPCPADKHTKRQEVKDLLLELEARYPTLRENIFGGLQTSELKGWKPERP